MLSIFNFQYFESLYMESFLIAQNLFEFVTAFISLSHGLTKFIQYSENVFIQFLSAKRHCFRRNLIKHLLASQVNLDFVRTW